MFVEVHVIVCESRQCVQRVYNLCAERSRRLLLCHLCVWGRVTDGGVLQRETEATTKPDG